MRKKILINDNWKFVKSAESGEAAAKSSGESIRIPHTWNAVDGQDGGNDYYRGQCWYVRELPKPELNEQEEVWLEFAGVAMTAEVYLNGKKLAVHEGGYSTFRVNITGELQDKNILTVSVDNSQNDHVYPQKADFTFYGGIYRDVALITVPTVHFALDYWGAPGIKVTPVLSSDRKSAEVTVEAWICGDATEVRFMAADQIKTAEVEQDGHASTVFIIESPHLWDGIVDPYLYTAAAELDGDRIETTFGVRTFAWDVEKGFFLNGRCYPICGAARHQD